MLTRQRRPSCHFCPNQRLRRARAALGNRRVGPRRADLFPFRASDARAPSGGHAPVFAFFGLVCWFGLVFFFVVVRSQELLRMRGGCLLIALRCCMETRFREGPGKRNSRTEFSDAFPRDPRCPQRSVWVGTARDAFGESWGRGIRSLVRRASLAWVGLWLPRFYRPHVALSRAPFV